MAIAIYNCKRCKQGKRVDYPIRDPQVKGAPVRYHRIEGVQRVYPGRGDLDSACPNCGKDMEWNWLSAHTVPEHKCDARCTSARGHVCNCSCGGKNHGSGW